MKDSGMAQELAGMAKDGRSGMDSSNPEIAAAREERVKAMMETDKLKQRKREVTCAVNLRERIQPFMDESQDEPEFVSLAQAEAADIAKSAFGHTFCIAIGTALELEATEFLGFSQSAFSMDAHGASLRRRARDMSSNFRVLGAGLSAIRAGSKAIRQVETVQKQVKEAKERAATVGPNGLPSDTGLNPEQAQETMDQLQESLPAFLELAWAINVRDISRTLKQVCHKLLRDASVTPETRLRRAEALRILGREFYAIGKASETTKLASLDGKGKDIEEIKMRAEVGAMMTLAKAQGQEISEKDAQFLIQQQRMMKAQQQGAAAQKINKAQAE
jgi:hypothetical protein